MVEFNPHKPGDRDHIVYDMRLRSLDGEGNLAKSEYVRLLNQERKHYQLIPDPNGFRIDRKTPAKRAVLQVLSKNVSLSFKNIKALLRQVGYERGSTVLRGALKRTEEFGLAVRRVGYGREKLAWYLTERGRQVPLKQKTNMTLQWTIEELLAGETRWVFAADLALALKLDKKVVSSTLRKLYAKDKVVRQVLAGCNARLWAHKDNFNKGTMPVPPLPPKAAPKRKKATSASAAVAAQTSGTRTRNMCLPNKPTLVQALTDIVKEKIAAEASFSAHDITKALREKVLAQVEALDSTIRQTYVPIVDFAETGTVHVKGLTVPKIEHEDVKEVLGHLFSTGAMTGYDRSFNGTYLEYAKQVAVQAPAPSVDPDPDPALAPRVSTAAPYDGSSTI